MLMLAYLWLGRCYAIPDLRLASYLLAAATFLRCWAVDLYDPRVNARLAYQLYLRAGGWTPWRMTAF